MKRLMLAAMAASLAITAGACSGSGKDQASARHPKVTIGLAAPAAAILPPMLAKDQGFYDAEGLKDVDVSFIPGPQLVPAVAGGSVNIGISGAPAPELIALKNQDVKILGTWATSPGQHLVVAPGIDNIADLKGRTVGINGSRGGSNAMLMQYALGTVGLSMDDVKVQNMQDGVAQAQAFASGQVDAIVTPPPLTTAAMSPRKGSKVIDKFLSMKYFHGVEILVNTKWAEKNRDTVEAVLRAIDKAVKMWWTDKPAVLQTMSNHLKLKSGDPQLEALYAYTIDGLMTPQLIPVTEDDEKQLFGLLRANGFPEATDDKASSVIDTDYLTAAQK